MRLFILFLFALSALLPLGCDEPLVIDQKDNIAAIQLSAREENGQTILEWSTIDHPGFNKYWLVRVPDSSFLVTDSINFLNLQVLYESTDYSQNSFVDNVPLLSDGDYYQLYADVNGRLISSNEVLSQSRSFSISNHLTFNIITGGDGKLFMIVRDLTDGRFVLQAYDVAKERTIKSITIESGAGSRARLAYGDFGSGKKEIAFTNGGPQILFYDPVSLTINRSQTLSSPIVESMTCLPGLGLAIVQSNGNQLMFFSRKNNQSRTPLTLQGGFVSRNSFIEKVKGKNELIISINPDRLYRVAYNQLGDFTPLDYQQVSSSASISTDLSIDPQGEYILPSRIGEMFTLNGFSTVRRFVGDSTQNGFRTWTFSSSGDQIIFASIAFPSTVFIYNRSDFSLSYQGTLPQTMLLLNTVRVDDESYLIIQKNEEPFETIFSRL